VTQKFHIVCPHCRSVNRVPAARLTEGLNCGQCHASLFTGHPIGLTAASVTPLLHKIVDLSE
jgi:thioredoxin 2